ncbi:MAG: hypothetical protein Q8909_02045 [Bacteroidota bacterium]|nr:hypothetical protein [Bacteroidota bacterium]
MKIMIPVVDNSAHKLTIADGFNTSSHVCLYDIEKNHLDWIEASKIIRLTGNIAKEFANQDICGVITNHIKFMALGLFNDNGLKVYKSRGTELERNLDLFRNRKLEPFTIHDALTDSGCGSSCNSCSSTACKN